MIAELNYETLYDQIATKIKIDIRMIQRVIELINEGNTVPFIARYRKEMTGGLDEVQIKNIHDEWEYAVNLAERKAEVIRLIAEQDKLTDELEQKINAAS